MKGRLPDRPGGVRKSWKLSSTNAALIFERLRERAGLEFADYGEPAEGQEWRERKGALRRLIVTFTSGRYLSMSFRRNGHTVITMRRGL